MREGERERQRDREIVSRDIVDRGLYNLSMSLLRTPGNGESYACKAIG